MNEQGHHDDAPTPLDTSTRLAYMRTFQAYERTQMAWIRTALSLITFGFSISKVFELLQKGRTDAAPIFGTQTVGVVMIAMGVVSLTLYTLQHWRELRALRAQCPGLPKSISGATGLLLALLGLGALLGALIRD